MACELTWLVRSAGPSAGFTFSTTAAPASSSFPAMTSIFQQSSQPPPTGLFGTCCYPLTILSPRSKRDARCSEWRECLGSALSVYGACKPLLAVTQAEHRLPLTLIEFSDLPPSCARFLLLWLPRRALLSQGHRCKLCLWLLTQARAECLAVFMSSHAFSGSSALPAAPAVL